MSNAQSIRRDIKKANQVESDVDRLLEQSDRIRMNDHGLIEIENGDSETLTVTIGEFRSIVNLVTGTKAYETA